MTTDLTFITNEAGKKLLDRFKDLIKNTRLFDVLVGYFYTSGFYALYKSLETTEKIRILIGINTNKQTFDLIQQSREQEQLSLQFSHAQAKEIYRASVTQEMELSEDKAEVEEGVNKFIEWLRSGKLEIKAYPSENIHAKLYIMTFAEGDRDKGRVITGSSNFTRAGLYDNLEFNVELKNAGDYDFAKAQFDKLWLDAVDVKEQYLNTIPHTWVGAVSPYELYLKFLYEYFKDEISRTEELFYKYIPEEFKQLEYQEEAVLNAKKILLEYGGVFLSDVVGLGKTYMAAMLASQLDGRHLVLAPPVLLDEDNPGSWKNVYRDFNVPATFESLGKLDRLLERGTDDFKNIFIDEAHRFRSESNITYETLAKICRGKRVILVTATPLNNVPNDILSQIKLFQKGKKSTIPNLQNLDDFFNSLQRKLAGLDRQRNYTEFLRIVSENAKEIREKVLKYLMVRRTRSEIIKYFGEDLRAQNMKFPDVGDPKPIFYELNEEEDTIFNTTIELIVKKFTYSRYTPLLYFKGEVTQPEELAQRNMGKFMRILLVKRLESSFYAFRNSISRFIYSYESFLNEFDKGNVYVSKGYTNKIFEFLEDDNDEAIQKLIDEDKAQKHPAKDFSDRFRIDLANDLQTLKDIAKMWERINRDPKLLKFIQVLSSRKELKENKLIIFSESKETVEYLEKNLHKIYQDQVLAYTGSSGATVRKQVIDNFDAKVRVPKDDYRILISTEVLSEGVNLHRSNIVINYDIPWNPTRMMQRVGRINRVDTKFDQIHTYNFFPTKQANDEIKLKEAAELKIRAFIETLGNDARLLTEGEEIKSHDLFARLTSKKTITGEDETEESELYYLKVIKDIRDKQLDLFDRIKRLPKKARTARKYNEKDTAVLTYFRKGKLHKFYLASLTAAKEQDFMTAAKLLEVAPETQREIIGKDFYPMLDLNKQEFLLATTEEMPMGTRKGGRDTATQVLRILKSKEIQHYQGYTDIDEEYLKQVIRAIAEGGLPKQTTKTLLQHIQADLKQGINPLRILAILKTHIGQELLKEHFAESAAQTAGPREVILSEYLIG